MTFVVKNLSKQFDDNWIIKGISLEVERGEVLGIFGGVGVGKSTLIRTIAGIESHDNGSIVFDSIELAETPCSDRGFHFPNVTNDSFWRTIFDTDQQSQLADGVGQVLALEDALEKARGVLLLDNQFCFMDRLTREQSCEKLRRTVKEKNLAVVFATNDFDEILSICDRVAILYDGKIIQTGTPREVYEYPDSVEAARITGRNNLIAARRFNSGSSEMPGFQTRDGNHRLHTDRVGMNSDEIDKENVTLAIRPNHVSISFGASFPEDNLLKAKITNVIFRGETTLIMLDAEGLQLEALVLRVVGLNIGDECMVGLPPDRILVLKN